MTYNPDEMEFGFSPEASDEEKIGYLVDPGTYRVQVTAVKPGTSQSGNPKWGLELTILEPESFAGKTLFDNLTWTAKAENLVMRRLKSLGFHVEPGGRIKLKPDDLIGKIAHVDVQHRDYQGKKQNEVRNWRPDAGPLGAPQTSQSQNTQQEEKPELPF